MPIEIDNLSYTYSEKTPFAVAALKNISLKIDDGEFFGIIGKTGSGKSTLVLHLNGLIKLKSGKILVDGIDLSAKYNYKKLRSTVGIVFQYPEYQLFDETVAKDVAFGPRNIGLSVEETEDRVRRAIEYVGLNYTDIKDRSPFEISGGQKRRVALAGVLAMQPKVLVLDEPTAGLDPAGKQEILSLVRGLHGGGTTIIMISHNMDEISENCTKIALMHAGELVAVKETGDMFSDGQYMRSLALDVPVVCKIASGLRAKGFNIPEKIHRRAELVNAIVNQSGGGL